jgi:hypothetical protein
MWVWWMTELVFIYFMEVSRYLAIGAVLFVVAEIVLRRNAKS